MVVTIKIAVFWHVTTLSDRSIQIQGNMLLPSSASSPWWFRQQVAQGTSVHVYQTTWHHISEANIYFSCLQVSSIFIICTLLAFGI